MVFKRKKVNRSFAGNGLVFFIIVVFALFMLIPFYYSVVQALKPMEEIFAFPPRFYVVNPTFDNFLSLYLLTSDTWVPFGRYIVNSLLVLVGVIPVYIVIASMAAYPLAKCNFPGKKVFNKLVVWALLFTPEVTRLVSYFFMAEAGILDTYLALMLPPLASTMGVYLMTNFMSQIPQSVIEAAKIDGASIFRTYFSVVMPLVKPAWLTLMIFTFQSLWGGTGADYIFSESLKPLPAFLSSIAAGGLSRSGAAAAAALVMAVLPILTYIIIQSNVLDTMAYSGIKD